MIILNIFNEEETGHQKQYPAISLKGSIQEHNIGFIWMMNVKKLTKKRDPQLYDKLFQKNI